MSLDDKLERRITAAQQNEQAGRPTPPCFAPKCASCPLRPYCANARPLNGPVDPHYA